jgi:MerR family transcriptional regulator, light-induced transcriptional regulator
MGTNQFIPDSESFLSSLLKGDRKHGSEIAKRYSNSHENIKQFYEQIVKTSLYKVGELWEYNTITVAAEHLATSLSESIMNELYEMVISENRVSRKVVLGCVENELHQVGVKMVADIFEMHGWDTYFLGANIPTSELIAFSREIKPDIIALSLTVYSHLPVLKNMIREIQSQLPNIPVIAGGQAFRHGGDDVNTKFPKVRVFNSLNDIENYILKLAHYE